MHAFGHKEIKSRKRALRKRPQYAQKLAGECGQKEASYAACEGGAGKALAPRRIRSPRTLQPRCWTRTADKLPPGPTGTCARVQALQRRLR